jgi:hypothetical protein
MGNKQLKIWEQPVTILHASDFYSYSINFGVSSRRKIYNFVFCLPAKEGKEGKGIKVEVSKFFPKVISEIILSYYFWFANQKILFCKYLIKPCISWERFQNGEATKYSQKSVPEKQDMEISFRDFDSLFTEQEKVILCWIFGFQGLQIDISPDHRKAITQLWNVLQGESRKKKQNEEHQRSIYIITYLLRQQLERYHDKAEIIVTFRNKDTKDNMFERCNLDPDKQKEQKDDDIIIDNYYLSAKNFRFAILNSLRSLPLRYRRLRGHPILITITETEIKFHF